MVKRVLAGLCCLALLQGLSCSSEVTPNATAFLENFLPAYQRVYYEASKAQWEANTDISPRNDSLSALAEAQLARFIGRPGLIDTIGLLKDATERLPPLEARQIQRLWLQAAHRPGTIPGAVDSLIRTQTRTTSLLYGFEYQLPGPGGRLRAVSTNDLDDILVNSERASERRTAWEAAKSVGPVLKEGLATLQQLRNRLARHMGFSSFFALEVADYGMRPAEMVALMDTLVIQLRPLYEQLHIYARHELARRYRRPVPDLLPADWLPNRWGQNWPGLVESVDLDDLFQNSSSEWIVQQAERFYVSLGFPALNQNFWERSDLYPVPAGSSRRKNNHATAWHLDLDDDYRSLMSVQPNAYWFETTHHELGHIYYYIEYSTPEVPLLLREGANRSYHEGIGDLMGMAAKQRAYLEESGLLEPERDIDHIQWLLNDALSGSSVVFIPWAAGVMTRFEYELYEQDLPATEYNRRWWELVEEYQGIVPPTPRGEEYCDPATKTHIIDDPAQYYDYALSCVLKFHLHRHIARNILGQDLRNANYSGDTRVGDFLRTIMRPGASKDWRSVLREATGAELSAGAMLEYYEPLLLWLREENRGRVSTLGPALPRGS